MAYGDVGMKPWLAKRNGETFIEKSKRIHGDRYRYNAEDYKGALVKTQIVCDDHGPFNQRPSDHLAGNGCPRCQGRGFSPEEMIERLREIRGDRYDLSGAIYSGTDGKIKVICREHGEFFPTYSNFRSGQNCKACARESHISKVTMPKSDYLDMAKSIHGDRFDYAGMIYRGASKPVTVRCREHGIFTTRAQTHLGKHGGCDNCFRESVSRRKISNTAEFVEKSKLVHGDKYNYDKVDYKLNFIHVTITCPEHGDFTLSPATHLKGCGCQCCYKEKLAYSWMKDDYCEKFPFTTLYLVRFYNEHFDVLKVGISIDANTRIKDLCNSLGCEYETLRLIHGKSDVLWEFEKSVHTDPTLESHSWGEITFGGYTEFYILREKERLIEMFELFEESSAEEPK